MTKKRPSIGVGILIVNDEKQILLSPRLKPYGFMKLALPGGHVEWMEDLRDTAVRETFEEAGIKLNRRRVYNLYVYSEEINRKLGKHYITHYLIARLPKGQTPKDKEPHKHGPWRWVDPFNLPKRTWSPTKNLCDPRKGAGTLIRAFINEEGITFK
jgi:8-oxo-dGTP diphosphatase